MTTGASATLESLPDLVERVLPAVVQIDVRSEGRRANGSGFTISPLTAGRATVITNAHVVHAGGVHVVTLHDGAQHEATVRTIDASTDVAILEIGVPPLHELGFRSLATVRVGEPVIAIGSPYGYAGTVTSGIVSALDRTMPAPDGKPIDRMIQTDATINPGNSGGPLISLDGLVVGVNDQIRLDPTVGRSGLGFAVACDTVQAIVEEVRTSPDGIVRRANLGVRLARHLFNPEERARRGRLSGAVLIDEPVPGTPAAATGLRRGDVIVGLDGEAIDEPADVFRMLTRARIGKQVALGLIRDGEQIEVTIVPAERVAAPPAPVAT